MPWFWSDQYDLTLQIAGLADEGAHARSAATSATAPHPVPSRAGRPAVAASGVGPGNVVAKDIRLAEMLIARRATPDPRPPRFAGDQPEEIAGGLSHARAIAALFNQATRRRAPLTLRRIWITSLVAP